MDLGDTDPKIFGIFVNWLYTQTVVNEEGALPSCLESIHLWILADRFLVPTLQNHAMDSLDVARLRGGSITGRNTLHHIWDNTPEGSPLRMYITKCFVELLPGDIRKPERYPHQMLVSMFNMVNRRDKTRKGKSSNRPWEPSQEEWEGFLMPVEVAPARNTEEHSMIGGDADEAVES